MAHAVFAGGMMMNLADSLHFLSPLNRLSIINNQQAVLASFFVEPFENFAGLIFDHSHLAKPASPEEFAVIGAVSAVSQEFDQPADGAAVTDADSQDKIAVIGINVSRDTVFCRLEKSFDFLRDFADSNHKASMPVNIGFQSVYRLERPFLFNHHYHQISFNRSV
jgi:hypothetical protein